MAGLVVTVPVVATVFVLRLLFRQLDSLLGPWIAELIGYEFPGLGIVATLLLVLAAGVVARNYVGRRVIAWTESVFTRLPLVRRIYSAAKEIVQSATLSDRAAFRAAVMVEFPRRGVHSYGFVTSYVVRWDAEGQSVQLANVFIPGPPLPTTGVLVAVPEDEVIYLDLPVEEALKMVLSAGLAAPAELRPKSEPGR